jgi:hypothetical protein
MPAGVTMPAVSAGPTMAVPAILVYGLGILVVLLAVFLVMLLIGAKDVPSIGMMTKARQKKKPIICFHFSDGGCTYILPELEKLEEKISPNYYRTMMLMKFWDSSAQAAERIDGMVPLYHVFLNIPEAIVPKYAALFFQLEKVCKDNGFTIEGIQDLVFYCLSEVDAAKKRIQELVKEKKNVDIAESEALNIALMNTLKYIHVDDESSRDRVKLIIQFIYQNQEMIDKNLSKPIQFSWVSLIRGWDNLQGATSRNVEQVKICAEELAKLDSAGSGIKDILIYALAFCFVIGVLFFVSKAAHWI